MGLAGGGRGIMTKKEYLRKKQMEKERPANENLMNDWDTKAFDDMGANDRSSELGHICSSGFGDRYDLIDWSKK